LTAMFEDSFDSSHPVIAPVTSPTEFPTIKLGAALIRMLESVVGSDVFNKALKNYLTKHQYGNANSKDLWHAFPKKLPSTEEINVEKMMETWTLQMGLPLVTIVRDGRHVTCRQERFVV
ncbi:hypothetical protein HELRODRAFT_145061, partial [Helobdella robusta]